MNIDRRQAEQILLERLNRDPDAADRFVIIDSELAPRGDCWIIRANSAAYAETGDFSRMYVGVNAYLIDCHSGDMEIVGSAQQVEEVLQERYDSRAAGGRHYVLACRMDRNDKPAIIRLHRLLDCSLTTARQLLEVPNRFWLHGRRQALLQAAELLRERGVAVDIELIDAVDDLPQAPDWPTDFDDLREQICRRVTQPADGGEQ